MFKNCAIVCFLHYFLFSGIGNVVGQELQNFVVSTQGDFNESADASISWTLGEVASSYYLNHAIRLNEGFNQPFEDENYHYPIDDDFAVFPNPTLHDLIITFKNSGHYSFQIYNAIGQIVLITESEGTYLKLDISGLANSLYLIQIKNDIQTINSTLKIIKTD